MWWMTSTPSRITRLSQTRISTITCPVWDTKHELLSPTRRAPKNNRQHGRLLTLIQITRQAKVHLAWWRVLIQTSRTLLTSSTTQRTVITTNLWITPAGLIGTHTSRCRHRTEHPPHSSIPTRSRSSMEATTARCETWSTTTTAVVWVKSAQRTRLWRAATTPWASNSSNIPQVWEQITKWCNKISRISARLRWPQECAHALRPAILTLKTQISSEVNYIAL